MILCCGEALIDMIPFPAESGRDGFVPHSGGAVFNTAIALGRLGVQTGMLTGLSNDLFGQQLRASLKASHVDTSCVIASDRPTTLAFIQLADGHAAYSFFDENSAGRMLSPGDMPILPDEVSALYFGGISLACEPGADAYAALLERAGGTRAVMLDSNIRAGLIRDTVRYRARLDRMVAMADIVKVSDEDLNWIMPVPVALRKKVGAMLDKGPSLVILTRGCDGATGFLRDGSEVHVPAARVQIVDTLGAGDTFNSGVLARLSALGRLGKADLAHLPPEMLKDALAYGARVAAVTVARVGANAVGEFVGSVFLVTVARVGANPPWAEGFEMSARSGVPGGATGESSSAFRLPPVSGIFFDRITLALPISVQTPIPLHGDGWRRRGIGRPEQGFAPQEEAGRHDTEPDLAACDRTHHRPQRTDAAELP